VIAEIEPHRVSILDKHGRWVERKMPHFPEDMDPFGEIPIETELVRNQIMFNLDFFRRMLSGVSGGGTPSQEGNVSVCLNKKDDEGRICPVEVRIDYVKTRIAQGNDATRIETHRLFLYENGIGVRRVEDWVLTNRRLDETILSQKFITEEDLRLLDYARMIISQSSLAPIK